MVLVANATHPGNPGLNVMEVYKVHIVTDPPWMLDRVSDHARVNMSVVDYCQYTCRQHGLYIQSYHL